VRVTVVVVATGLVVTVKVAVVEPAGTVTEPGTLPTDGLLLDRAIDAPPLGAGPLSVTVPVALLPPVTVEALSDTDASIIAGWRVSGATAVEPLYAAVMVTDVVVATKLVLTVNDALVEPAATVTDPGTLAAELLLDSVTTAPPLGAGPLSVTVPVEEPPAVTLEGLRESDASVIAG